MKKKILFMFFGASVCILSECKKDTTNSTPQTPAPPTTESKISGYYWRCDSSQTYHYLNGNYDSYDHGSYSMSYVQFKPDHTYSWDNSPAAGSGTWTVPDANHLRIDTITYNIPRHWTNTS